MLNRRVGVAAVATGVVLALAWWAIPVGSRVPHTAEQRDANEQVAGLLRAELIANNSVQIGGYALQAAPLRNVYEARNYEPIWSGSRVAKANASLVLAAFRDAESEGLRTEDYGYEHLSAMSVSDDKDSATFELLLTESLLRYARDLQIGRSPQVEVAEDAGLASPDFDFAAPLSTALADGSLGSFLADLAPKHPEYRRLKKALTRYRAIEAAGGWPTLPSGTAPHGKNAELLRARLMVEDEAAAEGDLAEALMRYQTRNGLTPDGMLGSRALSALNIPVQTRIGQIRANMERWRWMPREFEPRRIVVNVPEATLQFIDDGTSVLSSKVIVGSPRRRTPVLRTEATAVTVNPAWHIPESIAWGEIWPRVQSDPYYLQRHGYVLVGRQLRQPPGPRNALGAIKFEMPNNFNVYLHDTPSRALFERDSRALSHGCVRVEQIAPLASLAISGDPEAMIRELSDVIATRKTTRINLSERIPVYLLYWTAIADDDGYAGFPSDVYGRDPALLRALSGALDPRPNSAHKAS